MYESPINQMFRDIETQIIKRDEQTIFKAIQNLDISVDRDELIKALNYDRDQYSKGYKDGANDILDKIRAEIDRQEKWLLQAGCNTYNVDIAFDAIKSAVGRGDVE